MKKLSFMLIASLTLLVASCNKQEEAPAPAPAEQAMEAAPEAAAPEAAPAEGAPADQCVCAEVHAPVCGDNGKTYSSACHAGCDGVKQFTDGACEEQAAQPQQ